LIIEDKGKLEAVAKAEEAETAFGSYFSIVSLAFLVELSGF